MLALAVLCGCLAAAANAATNVMQRSANREISDRWPRLSSPGRRPPPAKRRGRRRRARAGTASAPGR